MDDEQLVGFTDRIFGDRYGFDWVSAISAKTNLEAVVALFKTANAELEKLDAAFGEDGGAGNG